MFSYWKRIDSLHHVNRLLLAFTALLTLIVFGLLITIASLPNRYEFWLTPSMAQDGGLLKEGQVPKEYVQGFVATLFPTLNTWSKSGANEFAANLAGYHYFFTPQQQDLMEKTLSKYKEAQLFNRSQTASLYRFMEESDVKVLGKDSWEVHVVLRITQRINDQNPMVIADKIVDYHVRVVKVTLSRLQNPFQLAIDGYTQPEMLVRDLLASSTGEKIS